MLIIIQNLVQVTRNLVTSTFKVSVEYRGRQRDIAGVAEKLTPVALYLDILWSLAAFISLTSESRIFFGRHYHHNVVIGGCVAGYIGM